jgi:carboxylate-amine ligase
MSGPTPGALDLADLFEHSREPTFGVEEEVMVLDPHTLDLLPRAPQLLDGLAERDGYKVELPASQLEIITAPHADVGAVVDELRSRRVRLARALGGSARLAVAGAHPFAEVEGELNTGEHYERIAREYGPVARRQLVCGLHVHIGLSGAERVLAVHNALRSYLPELAALAANAPLLGGRDCGLASVRPLIAGMLPRQGVPPAFESWQELAGELKWGAAAGRLDGSRGWWWELRLHPELGTLEVRVPDAQSTIADVSAVLATSCALVLWLAELHDAGELAPAAPSWRIAENRWSAARHGVHGSMIDLRTGASEPTRERLHTLLERLDPIASRIGAGAGLEHAHALAEHNGSDRQLEAAAKRGPRAAAELLADAFLADSVPPGSTA